ncbi:hypothetical protein Pelo_1619 [Pelomyxa schiedti]|nr:hypothetical protein Pelo_1619 [Pelomyxa schiedti]
MPPRLAVELRSSIRYVGGDGVVRLVVVLGGALGTGEPGPVLLPYTCRHTCQCYLGRASFVWERTSGVYCHCHYYPQLARKRYTCIRILCWPLMHKHNGRLCFIWYLTLTLVCALDAVALCVFLLIECRSRFQEISSVPEITRLCVCNAYDNLDRNAITHILACTEAYLPSGIHFNKHIPAHMSTPTDIMQEHPTKPLHHKLHTARNTPPTETNWQNVVNDLNTPGIPPSIRNQALQVAANMKPLNNCITHLCDVAPTCHHGCDSPQTMKHILNRCGHNSDLRRELNVNPHKILNAIPNSPDSAKTAAKTVVGLYNYHLNTLARISTSGGSFGFGIVQKAAVVLPRNQQYDPP